MIFASCSKPALDKIPTVEPVGSENSEISNKQKVVLITTPKHKYMNWPGSNNYQCLFVVTSKCYEVYVQSSSSAVIDGNTSGDYTVTATAGTFMDLILYKDAGEIEELRITSLTQTTDVEDNYTFQYELY